jgi:hypothetical protein
MFVSNCLQPYCSALGKGIAAFATFQVPGPAALVFFVPCLPPALSSPGLDAPLLTMQPAVLRACQRVLDQLDMLVITGQPTSMPDHRPGLCTHGLADSCR